MRLCTAISVPVLCVLVRHVSLLLSLVFACLFLFLCFVVCCHVFPRLLLSFVVAYLLFMFFCLVCPFVFRAFVSFVLFLVFRF